MVDSYRPKTLSQALDLMREKDLIPFAGGTDLMVKYQSWKGTLPRFPKDVLFLNQLEELKGIMVKGEELIIGAGVTLSEVADYSETPKLLKDAVLSIAAPGIRNVGTLAGNVCNASPAGDSVCALYALDASVVLSKIGGQRELPIYSFITGPGKTSIEKGELLTAIKVPLRKSNVQVFKKVGTRKANALSKLSFSAAAEVKGGTVDGLALAFGAVGPTVVRSAELEKKIQGKTLSEIRSVYQDIIADYSAMIVPIDDQRSTAEYRKKVALNLLKNFLENDLLKGAK